MRLKSGRPAEVPTKAWFIGFAAWLVPGAGHFLQFRWGRGLIMGGVVFVMFLIGLMMGGHLFPSPGPYEDGISMLLQVPPTVANLGTGALYVFCLFTRVGFNDMAHLVTYEYGNTFLLVSGLLNYLVMLDAFDLAVGRKP